MLQQVAITNQLDWLTNVPRSADQAHSLPKGFDCYLKLLFPIGIGRSIPLAEYSFRMGSIWEMNARVNFWNQYNIIDGQPAPENLERITNREVAQAFGVNYDMNFTTSKISQVFGGWPPNLGSSDKLTEQFIQDVVSLLHPKTQIYFSGSVDNGDYHWIDGSPADWLETGSVEDLATLVKRDSQFPEYVFDSKRYWCLNHIEDTDYLIIGCSLTIAAIIMNCPTVECFRLLD